MDVINPIRIKDFWEELGLVLLFLPQVVFIGYVLQGEEKCRKFLFMKYVVLCVISIAFCIKTVSCNGMLIYYVLFVFSQWKVKMILLVIF